MPGPARDESSDDGSSRASGVADDQGDASTVARDVVGLAASLTTTLLALSWAVGLLPVTGPGFFWLVRFIPVALVESLGVWVVYLAFGLLVIMLGIVFHGTLFVVERYWPDHQPRWRTRRSD